MNNLNIVQSILIQMMCKYLIRCWNRGFAQFQFSCNFRLNVSQNVHVCDLCENCTSSCHEISCAPSFIRSYSCIIFRHNSINFPTFSPSQLLTFSALQRFSVRSFRRLSRILWATQMASLVPTTDDTPPLPTHHVCDTLMRDGRRLPRCWHPLARLWSTPVPDERLPTYWHLVACLWTYIVRLGKSRG